MTSRRAGAAGAAFALVALLTLPACTATGPPNTTGPTPAPTPTASTPPVTPTPARAEPGVRPSGAPEVLATGLDVPWSVVPLADGSALISERDNARVLEYLDGRLREIGTVPGAAPGGEGGLLGLAVDADTDHLYAYVTADSDNRVLRMPLAGERGNRRLGRPVAVLTGIPKAPNHNGGRIRFGPDRMLYVTTGDAGVPTRSQDPRSLAGKILRVTAEGEVPEGNPIPDSPVWSLGHRNPQGIAWDADGRMWAAEFGQNTWDELNLIEPGGNYGWPEVEGAGGVPGFIDPVRQWGTADASPSGLEWVRGTVFLAALRGQRLWAVHPQPAGTDVSSFLEGDFGRLRDVVSAPDGTLWLLTNNTARGSPRPGDDRLLRVRLEPLDGG